MQGRTRAHLLLVGAVLLSACEGDAPPPQVELQTDAFFASVQSTCATGDCWYDYSLAECQLYAAVDVLLVALLSAEPQACVDLNTAYYQCTTEPMCFDDCGPTPLGAPECDIESTPTVEPLYAEGPAFCQQQVACYADDLSGPEEVEFEEAECMAQITARYLFHANQNEECGAAFVRLFECFGRRGLPCDASYDDERAVCGAEVDAYESRCGG